MDRVSGQKVFDNMVAFAHYLLDRGICTFIVEIMWPATLLFSSRLKTLWVINLFIQLTTTLYEE
jgi:hypothetical protein